MVRNLLRNTVWKSVGISQKQKVWPDFWKIFCIFLLIGSSPGLGLLLKRINYAGSPINSKIEVSLDGIQQEVIVKIEGCDSHETACKIKNCLSYYGEIQSDITENTHYDPDPNAQPVGNGTYQVKMKLKRQIPNFIPAAGRKLRISYIGNNLPCTFLCSNCFRAHSRKSCKNEKVNWIDYVKRFMTNNDLIKEDWYGK